MEPLRIRRGDIFIAELDPVEGSEQGGIRPVLMVQNNTGNRFSGNVIAVVITSKDKRSLLPTHVDLGSTFGLAKDSVLCTEQIRTLSKSRLKGYIGHVDNLTMYKANQALRTSLDLPQNDPSLITLCPSCASALYDKGSHIIRRADRHQATKSMCDYCNYRYGYDYFLIDKQKRTPKRGGRCYEDARLSSR